MRRNRPSCQNTHKEAWTGKSSISTSWEIITPFWMCLWGQRGLCYDACTIYRGRSVRCSWSEPWTQQRACLRWHGAGVILTWRTCFPFGNQSRRLFQKLQNLSLKIWHIYLHSHTHTHTHTHKKNPSCIVWLYSHIFIIIGALHMCFRSNHKSQAYVRFCKKIIYPRTSLYKVCSSGEYSSPGTELLWSPRKESGELSPARSATTTPSSEKLFLIQMNGAKVGAKESGHGAACNHLSKQHWTHVFVRDQGPV